MPRKSVTDQAVSELAATLAGHIKILRKKRGWSQAELAEHIGSHMTHVNRVETGKSLPGVDFLVRLAKTFDVPLDALVTDDDSVLSEPQIADKSLAERMRLLDVLDVGERDALVKIIDAVVAKHRMRQFLESQLQPT